MELSLVVPAYNERENLAPLLAEIAAALQGLRYEVIVVDDGSTDGTLAELKSLRQRYPQLHVIAFERNAGQTAAFAAGFRAARAPVVVTLDADMQNDPADIPALVDTLQRTGTTAVAGYRAARRDTTWKRLQSRIANGVRNRLNGEVIRDTGCSLKAFRTEAQRAALAKHLATCGHCAGARASHLEVRVALARSAGNPHAFVLPRPAIRAGTLALWLVVALAAGLVGGWVASHRWGGPGGGGTLEDTRGNIVVQ